VLAAEFDFDLPAHLIAQTPAPRGTSKLMVLARDGTGVQHSAIARLPQHLRPGDLLVVNNTRVFAARLLGRRVPTGGAVECLLLSRASEDEGPEQNPAAELWDALVHPGQKLRPGAEIRFEGDAGALTAEIVDRRYFGRRRLWLRAERGGTVEELVDALGHVPLPPYIHRPDSAQDRERYQTVYAAVRGSVAAPTAGLHFSPAILEVLEEAGVRRTEITLHVGYGTFKPVRSETVEAHEVDPERYEIPPDAARAIAAAIDERRRVVAVGTTTTRALEDAAARGAGRVAAGGGEARIFIYPGFRFQVVDALLTNFHLPRSSLLMLVAAFAGRDRVLAAYREAIDHGYRFYSYGDAMLIE
jgi:S-adenosylmethionine:tRNA ribosyltransferase-isomerase